MFGKLKKDFTSIENPLIMGILNITPDSFYDGGKYSNLKNAIKQTKKMIDEGADIIDIGAFTSKPFSNEISLEEEKKRLFPILKEIKINFPKTTISIDTYRTEIAEESIKLGASMINDIYGGEHDSSMLDFIGSNNIPYVLMHMKGDPINMQKNTEYENLEEELKIFFTKKCQKLEKLGHKKLIIDPGFGFGKTIDQNFKMINLIPKLKKIHKTILVGISRKSMIYNSLQKSPKNSLNSTTILNTICIMKGAKVLRVHDVAEAKEVLKMINFVKNNH